MEQTPAISKDTATLGTEADEASLDPETDQLLRDNPDLIFDSLTGRFLQYVDLASLSAKSAIQASQSRQRRSSPPPLKAAVQRRHRSPSRRLSRSRSVSPSPPRRPPSKHHQTHRVASRSRSSSRSRSPSVLSVASSLPTLSQAPPQLTSALVDYHPASPTDDVRFFTEQVVRMAEVLDIELVRSDHQPKDAVEKRVHVYNSYLSINPQPLLEKDIGRKIKSVFSLLEEDERSEDINSSKSIQKEIGKSPEKIVCSKSTGVFQDEELLFSHKLQKDNDPDVDLFSSNKAEMEAEKKTLIKKASVISSLEEHSKVSENCQNVRQDESCLETTKANLDINPTKLLPCGTSAMKRSASYCKAPCYEPHGIQHAKVASVTGNNEETGVSFDYPMQADTLQNANKGRIKMTGKRRPPTRNARRLAAQESIKNEITVADCSALPFLKENCVPSALMYPSSRKLFIKNEIAKSFTPANSSDHLHETYNSPIIKSTAHSDVHDLFESNDLFANIVGSKATSGPKAMVETESHMRQVSKDGGQLSVPLSLNDANCEDLFQPRKPSKELSPPSFLEDEEDLSTTIKKTVKRKDLKPISQSEQDPQVQDIFEDDIFASEAVKLPVKTKTLMEANLFDDDVDIFADLAVKPKENSAKKKMEAKSIFDEDTDDIFSPSHVKTLIQKTPLLQIPSGTTSEFRTSSTFEDPLNAFEGQ
ncbi:hypothetical protein JD844_031808 [Phrynosoma platyrhinos]|uniref:FAM21/CAPZIP domain-containing protein n=1 Tax=Phrynosoma platyrhinos TaxID=52577 RepID=A0ABQ7T436_PHRPL|nr:hypothetical protein JD844_031808 [Phrynosoma platyrhinos]